MMDVFNIHSILLITQRSVSLIGVLIIIAGIVLALGQYVSAAMRGRVVGDGSIINDIRLNLARVLLLGLEFIVAADLIGTTTTPDYYALGLLAIIVLVRTVLSFSLSRELMSIGK